MSETEFVTFGCRLNTYESEVMRGHAAKALPFESQRLKEPILQDGSHGVASRGGRIRDDPLRPRWLEAHTGCRDNKGDDDAATLHHELLSYGWRQARRSCAAPRTTLPLAARPSRRPTNRMFITAASLSRCRLLRTKSCSRTCESN